MACLDEFDLFELTQCFILGHYLERFHGRAVITHCLCGGKEKTGQNPLQMLPQTCTPVHTDWELHTESAERKEAVSNSVFGLGTESKPTVISCDAKKTKKNNISVP